MIVAFVSYGTVAYSKLRNYICVCVSSLSKDLEGSGRQRYIAKRTCHKR